MDTKSHANGISNGNAVTVNGNANGNGIANGNSSSKSQQHDSADEAEMIQASSDMCVHAFNTLLNRLKYYATIDGERSTERPQANDIAEGLGGVFVTWSIIPSKYLSSSSSSSPSPSSSHFSLRGCIGTLKPSTQIKDSISRYAIHAAFHDPRFDSIEIKELPRLKVGVSILSNFRKAKDIYDWDIGTHGIILDIYTSKRSSSKLSATYLPEVCSEHSWTKEYCLQSLAEKAGYNDGNLIKNLSKLTVVLTKYESTRCEMTYQQYLDLI